MNRFPSLRGIALALVATFLLLTSMTAEAQTIGRSRLLPNPVPGAGNRVNIRDPQRGQGGGQFGDPRSGERTHNGIDLTAPRATPVQAVEDGVVIRSVNDQQRQYSTVNDSPLPRDANAAGNRVTIRHADGTTSGYFHMSGENQPQVGERVVAGQIIGEVGRTGNVPANADTHLHFETRDRNQRLTPPQIDGIPSTQLPQPSTAPSVTPRRPGSVPNTASFRLR